MSHADSPMERYDLLYRLYEEFDPEIREAFTQVRTRVLSEAPEGLRRGCHLQGNEFNVTLKPNFETGTDDARDVIDSALVYLLDLLEASVAGVIDCDDTPSGWARAYYADVDPEIQSVLDEQDEQYGPRGAVPESFEAIFQRIDVAYYEADAAEIGSLELNKVAGVDTAFEVLDIDDPFALVMGDSKSDLRVMNWVEENGSGIAAAPDHASPDVLEHVSQTDDLVFHPGDAPHMLRTAFVLDQLSTPE